MKILNFALPVALLAGLTGCPKEDETPLTRRGGPRRRRGGPARVGAEALTAEQVEWAPTSPSARGRVKPLKHSEIHQPGALRRRRPRGSDGHHRLRRRGGLPLAGPDLPRPARHRGGEKAEDVGVLVHHTWTGFTNGRITVDGTATSPGRSPSSRHVEHDLTWSRDGKQAHGTGDRTQTLLDESAGLAGGILIEGERTWTGVNGKTWQLDIQAVEARPQDPIPQAGAYVLTNPRGQDADHELRAGRRGPHRGDAHRPGRPRVLVRGAGQRAGPRGERARSGPLVRGSPGQSKPSCPAFCHRSPSHS
ncbi:MAG: hypothetical protein R3F43_23675 [bacterium]